MVLVVVGGAVGYRSYRRNRPIHPVLLQLSLNPEAPAEARAAVMKLVKQKLSEHELLVRVSKDVELTRKMKFASDEAAAADLGKRLFVEQGENDTPNGRMPTLNIGWNCKVKEYGAMLEVSKRISKDKTLSPAEFGTERF